MKLPAAALLLLIGAYCPQHAMGQNATDWRVMCPGTDRMGYVNTSGIAWDMLAYVAAYKDNAVPSTTTFTLCPDTTFTIDDIDPNEDITTTLEKGLNPPIFILFDGTTVECGANGNSDDNCIIEGGDGHIYSAFDTANANINGLTFTKSKIITVYAGSPEGSDLSFSDCHFKENEAPVIIYIANELNNEEDTTAVVDSATEVSPTGFRQRFRRNLLEDIHKLQANRRTQVLETVGPGMTVNLNDCSFSDNVSTDGVSIINFGGKLSVAECSFDNNDADVIIGTADGGTSSITKSCFTNNKYVYPGLTFTENGSTYSSSKNYGNENRIASNETTQGDICAYNFHEEGSDKCANNISSCIGECVDYEANSCQIGVDLASASSSPAGVMAPDLLCKFFIGVFSAAFGLVSLS